MRRAPIAAVSILVAASAVVAYRFGASGIRESPPVPVRRDFGFESTGAPAPSPETSADPAQALPAARRIGILLEQPSDFALHNASYALAAASDERALRELIGEAQRIRDPARRTRITNVFVARYAEIDAEAALDFIREAAPDAALGYFFRIFVSWAATDPDAAIDGALALRSLAEKHAADDGILQAYAAAGPETIAELRIRLAMPGRAPTMNATALINLSRTDPPLALDEARRLPFDAQMHAVYEIGRSWALSDAEAAYAYVSAMPEDDFRFYVLNGLFHAWSETAPERVVELLDSGVAPRVRSSLVDYGIARMARNAPGTTFDLLLAMENTAVRDIALQRMMLLWTQQDPASAVSALALLPETSQRALAPLVGIEFARSAPARALEWAAAHDGGFGPTWTTTMAEVARQDPQYGFDLAMAAPPEQRETTATIVISSVAESDPEAAADYWRRLPPELQPNSVSRIISPWAERDIAGAEAWAMALPRGAVRDQALVLLSNNTRIDSTRLPQIINGIDAESLRSRTATTTINRRFGSDPPGAREMLSQLNLSADTYQAIVTGIEQRERSRTGTR